MEKYLDSKILVVDDEPANVFLLEGILEGEGYSAGSVSNGMDALKAVEADPPDVILLDLMMPGMSGFEVLDKLAEEEKTRDIPVVIISAKTDVEDVKVGLDRGAMDYIKKPINETDLLARLRTALRLKNKEDALKRMIRLKNQFVSIVSHDLRAPLSHMILYGQVLSEKKSLSEGLKPEHREFLEYVTGEANRLIDYVEKLLNLAYLESGKLQLKKGEHELSGLMDETAKIYSAKMENKGVLLKKEYTDGINVEVDRTLFMQVISNLLNNAVKFTPAEGTITMKTLKSDGKVLIKIADTGVGIKPEFQDRLFTEFQKYFSKGTEGEKGTGLGLSICKKILETHGFEIDFTSERGKGTEFTITI